MDELMDLEWVPHEKKDLKPSKPNLLQLRIISLEYVARNVHYFFEQVQALPSSQLIDLFKKMCQLKLVDNLQRLMSNLSLLERLIKHPCNWITMHQALNLVLTKEKDFDYFLAEQKKAACEMLKKQFTKENICNLNELMQFVHESIILGSFLTEHGRYKSAYIVFECVEISDLNGNIEPAMLSMAFDIALRTSHVLTVDCKYNEANKAILNTSLLLSYMHNSGLHPNCALFYTTCSMYMFSLSQYDKAYNLAVQAVQEISCDLSPKIIVDTLRQACKVCIIKRIFSQAHIYINEALKLAKYWFGEDHPKYADCLADYGFYLISVDSVTASVKFYVMALQIRQSLFGDRNLVTSMTHEDLAYAIYVRDYSIGNFESARGHAEQALKTMVELLPEDHLMLSSVKRVQALILEEIALDSDNKVMEARLLGCAEKLHLDALKLAKQTFGEGNVQTAKHYGNLGRLYQSMKRFKEAEVNHVNAIEIKEKLLGKEHYEVALSIGHLASLYNYDMKRYDLAEPLYLRSIDIGRKLFGVWYSGLEYDYRGLAHLYEKTNQHQQSSTYHMALHDWMEERRNKVFKQPTKLDIEMDRDTNIKTVLSNIKKNASYGSGSSGSNT
eukprot:TCONS_00025638-protein